MNCTPQYNAQSSGLECSGRPRDMGMDHILPDPSIYNRNCDLHLVQGIPKNTGYTRFFVNGLRHRHSNKTQFL